MTSRQQGDFATQSRTPCFQDAKLILIKSASFLRPYKIPARYHHSFPEVRFVCPRGLHSGSTKFGARNFAGTKFSGDDMDLLAPIRAILKELTQLGGRIDRLQLQSQETRSHHYLGAARASPG
jgi:hypothetical protein